ncbi:MULTISPECIES: hypothetical protein [unclassified Caballeronia]|uniref:hypothetical protein n=1 Tax=unclassified Caballeronia TaxID=2646786 RepID=UPI002862C155|nr:MULTISPECIES: hypothetical protein [unclassified Caballeronia]MDR5740505.1 hypothetical protein [Caballeronia sp. LZ016]MDR5808975.1 hypothetical protein [Caballeronia sp. LZ019]
MNVTNPLATHRTQASASTLPIKRSQNAATSAGTAKSTTAPTTPANPPHLGNTIDTTA